MNGLSRRAAALALSICLAAQGPALAAGGARKGPAGIPEVPALPAAVVPVLPPAVPSVGPGAGTIPAPVAIPATDAVKGTGPGTVPAPGPQAAGAGVAATADPVPLTRPVEGLATGAGDAATLPERLAAAQEAAGGVLQAASGQGGLSSEGLSVAAAGLLDGERSPAAGAPEPVEPPKGPSRAQRAARLLLRLTRLSSAWGFFRHGFAVQRLAERLVDSSRSPESRIEAARDLGELARPESIEVLGAVAADEEPALREAAGKALELVADQWSAVLRREVRTRAWAGRRAAAVRELGILARQRPELAAIEALGDSAAIDPSREVRLWAIEALSRIAHPKSLAALSAIDGGGDAGLASALAVARGRAAARLAESGARAFLYTTPPGEFEDAKQPLYLAALKRVVAVSAVFTAVEFVGSMATGSLSLKADATHLAADLAISFGALVSIYLARRPPNSRKTYGYLKLEPLMGLLSSVLIGGMAVYTAWEAVGRLADPSPVPGLAAMALALAGLAANGVSTLLLYRYREENLSMKGAFLHAAADAVGSVGIIIGGFLMWAFGWYIADPIISFLIVALVGHTAWGLAGRSARVLMDSVPEGVTVSALEADLMTVDGAAGVADLHVWSLNSSERALTAKLLVRPGTVSEAAAAAATDLLQRKHGIRHTTIEVRTLPPQPPPSSL